MCRSMSKANFDNLAQATDTRDMQNRLNFIHGYNSAIDLVRRRANTNPNDVPPMMLKITTDSMTTESFRQNSNESFGNVRQTSNNGSINNNTNSPRSASVRSRAQTTNSIQQDSTPTEEIKVPESSGAKSSPMANSNVTQATTPHPIVV